jgi:hypothetical protein
LITLLFLSLQNSEGGGYGNSGDSFADPCQFLSFPKRPKFNFQPLSFTFETFGKKLVETKIVARVNVKTIKAKNIKKAFKSPAKKRQQFFTKICQQQRKLAVFWTLLRLC